MSKKDIQTKWGQLRWGDIATLEYGRALRGYQETKDRYPVFGTNGQIGWHSDPLCHHAGVIIGRKGAYRGVHYSPKPFFVIDTAFYLEAKQELDYRWAYYSLLSQDINSMDSGSAIPSTSREAFYNLPVLLPPINEQRTIAHILGTLDEKIELNRRMNETLEGMARAIFKSWFVDFDPVRAKAEGRPSGLPPEIEALFPDSFQDSELGEIPKGWGVGTIKENCTKIHNGGTPNRKESQFWEPASIPWLTSGEVRQNIIIETENFISELGLKHSSAKWLPADSTVVALYGATAGQVSITTTKLTTNQAICGLVPKKDYRYFNHIHMANSSVGIANLARGSAQQNISKGIVEATITVLPNSPIIRVFDKVVCEIYKKLKSNLHENLHITAIRDTLLPKLISGELRVPNTERIVEGCV